MSNGSINRAFRCDPVTMLGTRCPNETRTRRVSPRAGDLIDYEAGLGSSAGIAAGAGIASLKVTTAT